MTHDVVACLARSMRAVGDVELEKARSILERRLLELELSKDLAIRSDPHLLTFASLSERGNEILAEVEVRLEESSDGPVVLLDPEDCLWCGARLKG